MKDQKVYCPKCKYDQFYRPLFGDFELKCAACGYAFNKSTKTAYKKKISIFSRKGLQRMFPTAKIVRHKESWEVRFPLPTDFKNIDKFKIY